MNEIKKTILVFGSLCVVILLLFQLQHWSLFALGYSENIYIIILSLMFLITGILSSRYFFINKKKKQREKIRSSLSKQELKVLNLIADGKSNKEIADMLYIAETTVKSHVSNILMKFNAKRRTEAVKVGKELSII